MKLMKNLTELMPPSNICEQQVGHLNIRVSYVELPQKSQDCYKHIRLQSSHSSCLFRIL